ncbi:MAG: M1 family aminopeptidase [bacterium]
MRKIMMLVLLGLIGRGAQVAAEALPCQYDIDVRLNPLNHTLAGTEVLTLQNTTDMALEEIHLVLGGNFLAQPNPHIHPILVDYGYSQGFDPGWTKITGVKDKAGQSLSFHYENAPEIIQNYSLENVIGVVKLPQPLEPGELLSLEIAFETRFPENYLMGDNSCFRETYTWRFGWNPILRFRDNGAWSDKMTWGAGDYQVRLWVPAEFKVASGADIQTEELTGEEKVVTMGSRMVMGIPLSISQHYQELTVDYSIPTTIYYLPKHKRAALKLKPLVGKIIDYYHQKLGRFPRSRLVVVDNNIYGGMAADGMVILGREAFKERDLLVPNLFDRLWEYILAHEIGHLWFGLSVNPDFDRDNFLSEALAEFVSISYFEDQYGLRGGNLLDNENKGLLYSLIFPFLSRANLREHLSEFPYREVIKDHRDEEIIKHYRELEYAETGVTRIYNKGYLVVRNLAHLIGEDKFWEILSAYAQEFAAKNPTSEDFERFTQTRTDIDLTSFFHDWLHGRDRVDYAIKKVKSESSGTGYLTKVSLENKGTIETPIEVEITTDEGEMVRERYAAGSGEVAFHTRGKVEKVVIDPDFRVPDVNRLDNCKPRRVAVDFSSLFFPPLDAYYLSPFLLSLHFGYARDFGLSLYPYIEEDEEENILIGGGGQFFKDLGWDRQFYLGADYYPKDQEWQARTGLVLAIHRAPNIGVTGRVNQPTHLFYPYLEYHREKDKHTYHSMGLGWSYDDFIKRLFQVYLDIETSIPSADRYEFSKFDAYALKGFKTPIPNLIFGMDLWASRITGPKRPIHLELEDLVLKEGKAGEASIAGQASLLYPLLREREFKILNTVIFEELETWLSYEGGRLYDDEELVEKEDTVKGELVLGFTTIDGLRFGLRTGYAKSLLDSRDKTYLTFSGRIW